MSKSNLQRFREIITVLRRYKVFECFSKQQNPENVRIAFEELGPFFIKLGQLLSSRTDILAPIFIRELEKLQTEVKSDDFDLIKPLIEEAMDLPIEDVFAHLEKEAFASASVAQVHKGYLKNGDVVAVKVQHPGTYEMMMQDMKLLKKALPLINLTPVGKIADMSKVIRDYKKMLISEFDFIMQAELMERFRANNMSNPYVCSPKTYMKYSSSTLLVMEFMEGETVSHYLNLAEHGEEPETFRRQKSQFAQYIVESFMKQVFEDGFFHADPHPGNILLNTKGGKISIAYLDFGIMGTLEESMIKKLNELIIAFGNKNSDRFTQILLSMCHKSRPININKMQRSVADTLYEYFGMSLDRLNISDLFHDISRLCNEYGLIFPENTAFLFKGCITIASILRELDPTLSLMRMIQPHAYKYLRKNFNLENELLEFTKNVLLTGKAAPSIPLNLLELIRKTSSGKLRITSSHEDLDAQLDRIGAMVNRLSISIVLAALILGFCLVIQSYNGTLTIGIKMISILGYFLIPLLTILFIASLWWGRGRRKT